MLTPLQLQEPFARRRPSFSMIETLPTARCRRTVLEWRYHGALATVDCTAFEVTKRIYERVKDVSALVSTELLVALQSGDSSDRLFLTLSSMGIRTLDLCVPLDDENRSLPFDGHPNAGTHRRYADALTPWLAEVARRL